MSPPVPLSFLGRSCQGSPHDRRGDREPGRCLRKNRGAGQGTGQGRRPAGQMGRPERGGIVEAPSDLLPCSFPPPIGFITATACPDLSLQHTPPNPEVLGGALPASRCSVASPPSTDAVESNMFWPTSHPHHKDKRIVDKGVPWEPLGLRAAHGMCHLV